jgi:hypothetical protein
MQNNLNAALNTAKQELLVTQDELAANTAQMHKDQQLAQKEAERATTLEEQLALRNQQIAGIIQSLATRFDLGERPLPVMGDIKAEELWQQHERVITLLTTRLQSEQQAKTQLQQAYQAETVKRAEKELLLDTLQTTLATQTDQVCKLEQALAEQKLLLQQQQDQAQQVLSSTLEKHLSELARLTELEQQALDLVNTKQQIAQLEEKLTRKDAVITQLEKTKPVEPVNIEPQPQPAPIKPEEKATPVDLKQTATIVPKAPPVIEQAPVSPVKEPTGGMTGKFKSLFGTAKQEPKSAKPQVVESKQEEPDIQPVAVAAEQPSVNAAKGQFGKLKNLLGSKQEEPDLQPPPVAVEQPPVRSLKDRYGKTKYYFGDIKQQSEEIKQDKTESPTAPVAVEQPSVIPAKNPLGKFKNLFGSKPQPEAVKQEEPYIQPAPVVVEQPPVSPAKNPLGKFKNLLGSKPQPEAVKQEEPDIQPVPATVEQPPVVPAKGPFGKLKNLFGKTK